MEEFARIKRLPPYVFNITGELKAAARKRGEDVIDLSMGNPDQPTDRKSTRLNSSHSQQSRMPSSA